MEPLNAEVISLRAERDALLNADVDAWLVAMSHVASVDDYRNSLSWRVTRPLRSLRTYQLVVSRDGFVSATMQGFSVVKRRLSRR